MSQTSAAVALADLVALQLGDRGEHREREPSGRRGAGGDVEHVDDDQHLGVSVVERFGRFDESWSAFRRDGTAHAFV